MRAVIFDLDGVLVFTDKYHYQAWKSIAEEKEIFFDERVNDRLRGVSRMDSLDIILENYHGEKLTQEEKEKLAEKKNGIYRELLSKMTPEDVSTDVRMTLRELKTRGYQIALGSSSKNAKFILERVRLLEAFDAIADGNVIRKSKPDPEVFLKAATYLKTDPKECVIVEDARAGIEAGKAAGMKTAAIGDVVRYGLSDYSLGKLSDLLDILK